MTSRKSLKTTSAILITLAFLILCSYEFARPGIKSLYIEYLGSANLPFAWLGVAVAVTLTLSLYAKALNRFLPVQIFIGAALITVGLLALLGACLLVFDETRFAAQAVVFLLYIWKDVYIVVLVELFWTMANGFFEFSSARRLYGWFCASGSVGAISGDFLASLIAPRWGTPAAVSAVAPCLILAAIVASLARRHLAAEARPVVAPSFVESVRQLQRSRYIVWLVLLIGAVQVSVNLVEYQFSRALEIGIADPDQRTAIIGQVFGSVAAIAFVLQVLSGPILKRLGVAGGLVVFPTLVFAAVAWFAASAQLIAIKTSMVVGKALDYSIFRTAKEMLYLPLSDEEKTRGKATVDIFAYRVAKGVASLLLLGLGAAGLGDDAVNAVLIASCAVWIGLAVKVAARFRSEQAQKLAAQEP